MRKCAPLILLLLAADVFLLPSLDDVLPLVLLEAMARGRPVVASDRGAIAQVIEDRADGRIVPPGDRSAARATGKAAPCRLN